MYLLCVALTMYPTILYFRDPLQVIESNYLAMHGVHVGNTISVSIPFVNPQNVRLNGRRCRVMPSGVSLSSRQRELLTSPSLN
jgi:hypothetical protein